MPGVVVVNQPSVNLYDKDENGITSVSDGAARRLHVDAKLNESGLDAFDRLRVSQPFTIFDFVRRNIAHLNLFYSDLTTGSATVVTTVADARTRLHTSGIINDKAIQQTRQYFVYQPGKSQLAIMTFNANGNVANVSKKIGQYDLNNGVYLDIAHPETKFVVRSDLTGSVVNNEVTQSSWNRDKLDGTGPSGVTLDWNKAQLLMIDYQWLGVGKIRCSFVVGDQTIVAHEFFHSNIIATPWARTMNVPLRTEIESIGTSVASNFDIFCQTIISEGGHNPELVQHSADRGINKISIGTDLTQVIGIRLQAGHQGNIIIPDDVDILAASTSNFRWAIILNPSVPGTPTWTTVLNSGVEYDINRNGIVTGGTLLASGYGSKKENLAAISLDTQTRLGYDLLNVADELILAVQTLGNTEKFLGSIRWKEVV